MPKNKIILLFPDGVGIRNYLYSDVFKGTEDELVLFHNFDDQTAAEIVEMTALTSELKIPKYNESPKEKFLRELICLSRLHYNAKITQNESLLINWKSSHNTFEKKLFYKLIGYSAPFFKKYASILSLEKAYQKAIRKNPFYHQIKAIFEQTKPNKIFCSHQRGLQCATIFAVAEDLNIETITVIYSWDNLPKARMALRADKYLVWSDYMKEEVKQYYPEIDVDKIFIAGTPQFEFYNNRNNIIDKETFYRKYDLELDKRIICYSGDDILTSPDDPKYLADLAEKIIENNLQKEFQILFRRCPVDFSDRYNSVLGKYSSIIKEAKPEWNFKKSDAWTSVYPTFEDVKILVSTAYYCDVVVNVGSTMAFDFSMFNKPCVYINYDQEEKANQNWRVNTIYKFQHFKSMPTSEAVIWLNSRNEIKEKVFYAKNNSESIEKWRETVVNHIFDSSNKIKFYINK